MHVSQVEKAQPPQKYYDLTNYIKGRQKCKGRKCSFSSIIQFKMMQQCDVTTCWILMHILPPALPC